MTETLDSRRLVAATRRPHLGPSRLDPVQKAGIAVVSLMPLVPRPTFAGPTSIIAPAFVGLLVALAGLRLVAHQKSRRSILTSGAFAALIAATVIYGARVGWNGQGGELSFVISRVALLAMILACCTLFAGPAMDRALRALAIGIIPLAALVAFIAFTGFHFLEAASPARTLGITFPWKKTAGVPRSFGEQGILIALALSYVLVYWRRLSRFLRYSLLGSCFILVAAGQSRNIFLGVAAVLAVWFFVVWRGRSTLAGPALVACGAAVLIMQQVTPLLIQTSVGRGVVGEGIFERNVESRFSLIDSALKMMHNSPSKAILGWSHEEWSLSNLLEVHAGVHNFFASSLLFLGLIGGALTIWALFVRPLGAVLSALRSPVLTESRRLRYNHLVVAGAGVLVSLNFYEGFFSFGVGLFVAATWNVMLGRDSEAVMSASCEEVVPHLLRTARAPKQRPAMQHSGRRPTGAARHGRSR